MVRNTSIIIRIRGGQEEYMVRKNPSSVSIRKSTYNQMTWLSIKYLKKLDYQGLIIKNTSLNMSDVRPTPRWLKKKKNEKIILFLVSSAGSYSDEEQGDCPSPSLLWPSSFSSPAGRISVPSSERVPARLHTTYYRLEHIKTRNIYISI